MRRNNFQTPSPPSGNMPDRLRDTVEGSRFSRILLYTFPWKSGVLQDLGCSKQSNVLGYRFCLQASPDLKNWKFPKLPKIWLDRLRDTPFISKSGNNFKSGKSDLVWLSSKQGNLMFSDNLVQVSSFRPRKSGFARTKTLLWGRLWNIDDSLFELFSDFRISKIYDRRSRKH